MSDQPQISEHYDAIADKWDEIVDMGAREDVLWSTLESMLPDVAGERILDAGCGSGVYSERLVDAGADVVGVDVSEKMLEEARDRVPDAAFRRDDVTDSLDWLDDDSVDVVLCQHVLSHVEDLTAAYEAFSRVLDDGGTLVVSTHNPAYDFCVVRNEHQPEPSDPETTVHSYADQPTYGDTERFDVVYGDGPSANRGTYYRRRSRPSFLRCSTPGSNSGSSSNRPPTATAVTGTQARGIPQAPCAFGPTASRNEGVPPSANAALTGTKWRSSSS
ncbi:class I SAM-dependent methyltransferase [Halorubellus sp. PRR65]|uniref:class I SAM-dependent methyltransferase n=1 Tax=Halorubellus sp. PRR65 TaxID=3098148 RepID=UPI002B25F037|nr:class I SAM-dependent methyltransferase [Halorubellus sp. PRR65]